MFENIDDKYLSENGSTRSIIYETADIDNDGDVDVFIDDSHYGGDVLWLENTDGSGASWVSHTISSTLVNNMRVMKLADMDGDSDIDIVGSTYGADDGFAILYNSNGDGTDWHKFNHPVPAFTNWGDFYVADINSDSVPDLVSYTSGDNENNIRRGIYWFKQPTTVVLRDTPEVLNLHWAQGEQQPDTTITVSNDGVGEMEWFIEEELDWLSVTPESGTLNDGEKIEVTLKAESFPGDGTYNGRIYFTGSGGWCNGYQFHCN